MFPNLDEEPEAVLAGLGAGCRASRAEHGYTCFSHANGESSLGSARSTHIQGDLVVTPNFCTPAEMSELGTLTPLI